MMTTRARVDRERLRRTLTFWLRPAFVLRAFNRFQRVAGFDRAIALASSALTALIPIGYPLRSTRRTPSASQRRPLGR